MSACSAVADAMGATWRHKSNCVERRISRYVQEFMAANRARVMHGSSALGYRVSNPPRHPIQSVFDDILSRVVVCTV